MKLEIQAETVKAAPAVGGVIYSSITLNEIVALATLLYIGLQTAYLIWKWLREYKRGG